MVEDVPSDAEALFAVVDLETTGFSPLVGDKIIEVAIVRVRADGSTAEEYVTLVNPLRDVGATHVHGIGQQDVASAPTFQEILGDVLSRLAGVIMVGHNVRYDRDFLAAELSSAGVFLPAIPSLCTLKMAYRLHPMLANHRLATCCAGAGLASWRAHDALHDAGATAQLLAVYLKEAQSAGMSMHELLGSDLAFPASWPSFPASDRRAIRIADGRVQADTPYLARIVAGLASVRSDEQVAPYMDLLDRALEDRQITEAEGEALRITASDWGLSREQVVGAHHEYMHALVVAALADGKITASEHQDLEAAAALLALGPGVLDAFLYEESKTQL